MTDQHFVRTSESTLDNTSFNPQHPFDKTQQLIIKYAISLRELAQTPGLSTHIYDQKERFNNMAQMLLDLRNIGLRNWKEPVTVADTLDVIASRYPDAVTVKNWINQMLLTDPDQISALSKGYPELLPLALKVSSAFAELQKEMREL